jgi:hypothetical protein
VVEHDLAKVGVEGSNPFARSRFLEMAKNMTKARYVSGLSSSWPYFLALGFKFPPSVVPLSFFRHAERTVRNARSTTWALTLRSLHRSAAE